MGYFQILSSCSAELANCCAEGGVAAVFNIVRRIIDLIQIIAPILLIVMASVELTKLTMNPDKKNGTKGVFNKFIAAAIVFFIPVIIDVVLGLMPQTFSLTACWDKARIRADAGQTFTSKYISPDPDKKPVSIIPDSSKYEDPDPPAPPSGGSTTPGGYTGGSIAPGDAKGILEGAEKVHTMYEQNRWAYYSDLNQLRWNDIKYSTNNPSRMTCCATFVGSAFYIGGVFSESEINKYNYNSQFGISDLCQAHGWIKITNYSQLAAGDIVLMSPPGGGSVAGHVQIYAGNGTWYNAGSTQSIQMANPYSGDASARFLYAWRKPA